MDEGITTLLVFCSFTMSDWCCWFQLTSMSGNWKVSVNLYSGTFRPDLSQEKGGRVPSAVLGPLTALKERERAEEDDITLASVAP